MWFTADELRTWLQLRLKRCNEAIDACDAARKKILSAEQYWTVKGYWSAPGWRMSPPIKPQRYRVDLRMVIGNSPGVFSAPLLSLINAGEISTPEEFFALLHECEYRGEAAWCEERDAILAKLTELNIRKKHERSSRSVGEPRKNKLDPAFPFGHPFVYFVQNTETYRVRIDKSNDPPRLFKKIASSSDAKLILLGYTGRYNKDSLHSRFRPHRVHGEWFLPAEPLIEFLRVLGMEPLMPNADLEPMRADPGRGALGPDRRAAAQA